jgi:hypothetical protein
MAVGGQIIALNLSLFRRVQGVRRLGPNIDRAQPAPSGRARPASRDSDPLGTDRTAVDSTTSPSLHRGLRRTLGLILRVGPEVRVYY